MRRVIVAETAGFCMGVKRAVDMVIGLTKKSNEPIYTYGPLIHNPQVIEILTKNGVTVIDDNRIPKRGTVVIRTHGVKPSVVKRFEKTGLMIFDATCPFVKKVQNIICEYSKKGFKIIIVGDKGHAEVGSYLGYASGRGKVISSINEAGKKEKGERICVVAQTTQDKKIFREIVKKLKKGNKEIRVFDTICSATAKRQDETLKLSRMTDAMIVVGGRNSANTIRLADICRSTGVPTYFIEEAKDLKPENLSKYNKIGITAGASTSKETIQEVSDYIKDMLPAGTPFQRKVWREIKKIPYGSTKTYKEIAEAIGYPHASRAVGSACKKNPLPIIVPCHRVVRSDGKLGGYSRGIKSKKALLKKENLATRAFF